MPVHPQLSPVSRSNLLVCSYASGFVFFTSSLINYRQLKNVFAIDLYKLVVSDMNRVPHLLCLERRVVNVCSGLPEHKLEANSVQQSV
ncbi:unnamed protein product [Dicrocoelium dendriticum]|nr:unnamed protein product [Dicrocoelium dendriticum]